MLVSVMRRDRVTQTARSVRCGVQHGNDVTIAREVLHVTRVRLSSQDWRVVNGDLAGIMLLLVKLQSNSCAKRMAKNMPRLIFMKGFRGFNVARRSGQLTERNSKIREKVRCVVSATNDKGRCGRIKELVRVATISLLQ